MRSARAVLVCSLLASALPFVSVFSMAWAFDRSLDGNALAPFRHRKSRLCC